MEPCLKNSCNDFAWQATLAGILSNLKGELQDASHAICQKPLPKQLTTEAIVMLYVILTFLILTVIGSSINGIELFCRKFGKDVCCQMVKETANDANGNACTGVGKKSRQPEVCTVVWKNCKPFLECFSIHYNVQRLLNTVSGEEHFNALHGIKTIGIIWVAVNHVTMFYATIIRTVTDGFQYVLECPTTQFINNGIFANDVFFVLSGFLNGYMFFDYYQKRQGKIPWVLFYISRFLRFTPLYLIVLGFYATLFTYIGSGPVWPTYNTNPLCRENWIWNVFYLNNFKTPLKQCMLTTWYIACDLQLYIISPIFLLPLMRRPKIGYALLISCICGSCFACFLLTKQFKLIDGISKLAFHSTEMDAFYGRFWVYFDVIYVKPYTRIGSYLVGIALGYFIYKRKFSEVKRNSMITLSIGWTVSAIFFWISFFAIYKNKEESVWETSVYNGVKDLLCSFSISWIIFLCITGQGGYINRVLSFKIFVPFSRISYCFYYIHMIAIEKYFLSLHELQEDFSYITLAFYCIEIIVWTLVASFVVSLIFERPLLNLMGLLLKKSKQEKKVQ